MLKLRLNNSAPVWLDLNNGVRVQVPPLGVAALRAAEHSSFAAYSVAKGEMDLPDDQPIPAEAAAALEGIFAEARIRALASKILAWEGIVGDDEKPLPVSPDALDAFAAHPALGAAFVRAYDASALEVVKEGNGSEATGSGKRGAAKATAVAVPDAA
jgi:hypothetical protein